MNQKRKRGFEVEQSKGKKQAVHLTVHSDSAIASKLEGKITTELKEDICYSFYGLGTLYEK